MHPLTTHSPLHPLTHYSMQEDTARIEVGEWVYVIDDPQFAGKIGEISQDDRDQRPYRVKFRDGRVSGFLSVDQIRRASMVSGVG